MITDLFKPAWKSDSADKRLHAIETLAAEDAEAQQILAELTADSEDQVAVAAIGKLRAIPRLHELQRDHASASVREAADHRLNALLVEDTLKQPELLALMKDIPDLAERLAAHAADAEVRAQAVHKLAGDQMIRVIEYSAYTDTRQAIAERIEDIEALEHARRLLRGRDKKAERIVKEKIDAHREAERLQAEREATISRLLDEAEYLTSHDWLPEFRARVIANRNQWEQLDFEVPVDRMQRYQTMRTVMDECVEQQQQIDNLLQSREQLLAEINNLVESTARRDLASAVASHREVTSIIELFSSTWLDLASQLAPQPAEQQRYEKMIHALRSANGFFAAVDEGAADRAFKELKWPQEFGDLAAGNDYRQQRDAERKAKQAAAAENERKLKQLHGKIGSIFRLARGGQLARAKSVYHRMEKAIEEFSGKDHQKLEERLKDAEQTLGKMDDWKNFATEPKYIELCDAMEKLVSAKLHPDNLAGKIKALQKQWKDLGYSEVSDQYWDRFKQAADKAYQPCADFFAQRHEARDSNLQQREQIVAKMRALLEETDWDNDPDYKAAQTEVRKISDQFAAIKDVERGAGQKQWKTFARLKDEVFTHLNVAYEQNIASKHKLVEQMTALAEAEPREENLAAMKMLQTRWKQVGITRRKDDQKAWKAFRKQADLVYDRLQALRKSHRDEVDQQLDGYRRIIREIEHLSKKASDLAEADHQFAELQQQYQALPDLPRSIPEKLAQGIDRDYQRACDRFDRRHQDIVDQLHARQIDALRQKAELCTRLEALNGSGDEQALAEINQSWDSIELHDSELLRRIEQRRASAGESLDREAIGEQRRLFCIQVEIAAGKDSPPEDRDRRMQYQLEQMNKSGLGQALAGDNDLERMEIDWLCMPGTSPTLQIQLDERFRRALDD